MPMSVETLRQHLADAFPGAEIAIDDLAGDGDHYRARIVSSAFAGLARVRQHQLVNKALAHRPGEALQYLAWDEDDPNGVIAIMAATAVPMTMASRMDRREIMALPSLLSASTMTSDRPASPMLPMLP